ncbi:hypothetical protein BHM03_00018624, partial [Ensete ventricosum]
RGRRRRGKDRSEDSLVLSPRLASPLGGCCFKFFVLDPISSTSSPSLPSRRDPPFFLPQGTSDFSGDGQQQSPEAPPRWDLPAAPRYGLEPSPEALGTCASLDLRSLLREPNRIARYGWYISVRQQTGTWIALLSGGTVDRGCFRLVIAPKQVGNGRFRLSLPATGRYQLGCCEGEGKRKRKREKKRENLMSRSGMRRSLDDVASSSRCLKRGEDLICHLVLHLRSTHSFSSSAFQYVSNHPTEPSSTDSTAAPSLIPARPSSSASIADCSKNASKSHTVAAKSPSMPSDICSDNADETSDLETPRRGKIREFDTSTEDLTFHDVNNGILGESFMDQPEDFIKSKLNQRRGNLVSEREITGGSTFRDRIESTSSDHDRDKLYGHARRLSSESVGSDISSIRGSELSFTGATNSLWDCSLDVPVGAEISNVMDAFAGLGTQLDNAQIVLPIDQRHKLNRVLLTMQRRLGTAKTDMEDLIARLNQEMAVKEYLTTKVHLWPLL